MISIGIYCAFWAVFYRIQMEGIYRFLAFLAVMMAESLLLLVFQNVVIEGFLQIANALIERMNTCYHADFARYQVVENTASIMICMLFGLFPLSGIIAFGALYRGNIWYVLAVIFPILAGILLAGGTPKEAYLLILLAALVMGIVANVPDRNLSGDYTKIRGRLMLYAGAFLAIFSLGAFYVVCPILKMPVEYLNKKALQTENGMLQMLWSTLPQISGGRLQLQVEGSAGGVDNGELRESKGYHFGKMKALEVTCSEKPEETMYLKGYIGAIYTGDSFEEAGAESFHQLSATWGIEDAPSLYIQNLPFLRMMYQENVSFEGEDEETPQLAEEIKTSSMELTVKNLNANTAYTYVPYCAYLNPYYQIQSGDGAVSGQELYEDSYSFYSLESYKQALKEWQESEHQQGSLDQIEASYENFVELTYLQVPDTGLESLAYDCQQMNGKEIEEICDFVVNTLTKGYEFTIDAENPPENEDFVNWFLYQDKKGYSTHFGASATMMFRLCGVPARYVVGYAIPESIFMPQADGSYKAIVEDDNAHAWTEIYLSGIGWVPIETTPGYVSELTTSDGFTNEQEAEASRKEVDEDIEIEIEENTSEVIMPEDTEQNAVVIVILVSGMLMITTIWTRRFFLLQKRLGKRRKTTKENVKLVYDSLYHLLYQYGDKAVPSCCDDEFAVYIAEKYPVVSQSQMEEIAQSVLHAYYGEGETKRHALFIIRKAYIDLAKEISSRLSFHKKVTFYLWDCFL